MSFKACSMCCAVLGAWVAAANAAYPERPIRLVISSPPAGTSDVLGRPVTQKLAESLGRQVVIDNRAGASGNIGVEIVARAAADGYTLLLGQT